MQRRPPILVLTISVLAACLVPSGAIDAVASDRTGADGGSPGHDPVLLIHGLGGHAGEFAVLIDRLVAAGWPAELVFAREFPDPRRGCNVDNAATIAAWVDEILTATGRARVDLVAHSMGSLSARYYLKSLGGSDLVNTFVSLGGIHHGLAEPCRAPRGLSCVWDELCAVGSFVAQLDADPATPGELAWVSIRGAADTTVPAVSSILPGAENIVVAGVEHAGTNGLQHNEAVFYEIARVLDYPPW